MSRALLALLATTALLAAGCGGDDGASESSPAPAPTSGSDSGSGSGSANTVVMKDIKFVPEQITVKAGTAITWTNEDSAPHDVVNAEDGQEPKSDLFGKGETYEFTPSEPGTIEYLCTVHPGMTGTITVE